MISAIDEVLELSDERDKQEPDAERLLQDLVAIPSPSCHEAEAAAFLVPTGCAPTLIDDAFVDEAGNAVGSIGAAAPVRLFCWGISIPSPASLTSVLRGTELLRARRG